MTPEERAAIESRELADFGLGDPRYADEEDEEFEELMDFAEINPALCVICGERPPDARTLTNLCEECARPDESPEDEGR